MLWNRYVNAVVIADNLSFGDGKKITVVDLFFCNMKFDNKKIKTICLLFACLYFFIDVVNSCFFSFAYVSLFSIALLSFLNLFQMCTHHEMN